MQHKPLTEPVGTSVCALVYFTLRLINNIKLLLQFKLVRVSTVFARGEKIEQLMSGVGRGDRPFATTILVNDSTK